MTDAVNVHHRLNLLRTLEQILRPGHLDQIRRSGRIAHCVALSRTSFQNDVDRYADAHHRILLDLHGIDITQGDFQLIGIFFCAHVDGNRIHLRELGEIRHRLKIRGGHVIQHASLSLDGDRHLIPLQHLIGIAQAGESIFIDDLHRNTAEPFRPDRVVDIGDQKPDQYGDKNGKNLHPGIIAL